MSLSSASDVQDALHRLGELLQFRQQHFAIAIVGGQDAYPDFANTLDTVHRFLSSAIRRGAPHA